VQSRLFAGGEKGGTSPLWLRKVRVLRGKKEWVSSIVVQGGSLGVKGKWFKRRKGPRSSSLTETKESSLLGAPE